MLYKEMWGVSPDEKRIIYAGTSLLGKATVYIATLRDGKVARFTQAKARKSDLVGDTLILGGVISERTTFGYIIKQTNLWKPFKRFVKKSPRELDYLDVQYDI